MFNTLFQSIFNGKAKQQETGKGLVLELDKILEGKYRKKKANVDLFQSLTKPFFFSCLFFSGKNIMLT